jgi:cyclomaltodextrinase
LNNIKPVMMLSEGSIPEHHAQAFDLTYSWNIYNALDMLLKGKRPATLIDELLENERLQFPAGSLRMRFVTNHDKNAWESPAVTRLGLDGLKLATVLINTIPGVPMIYTGEEVANDKKLGLFEKIEVDWNRSREVGEIYRKLFHLRKENRALTRGEMIRLTTQYDKDVYAFARVAGKDKIVVVLNFSDEPRFTGVNVPMARVFGSAKKTSLTEFFDGQVVEVSRDTKEQIVVALEPRAYKVFLIVN